MQPIQIQDAGRRVLPREQGASNFWQIVDAGRIVGWATSYELAKAKQAKLEAARADRLSGVI